MLTIQPRAQRASEGKGTYPCEEVHARHGEEREQREKKLHELELDKPGTWEREA